MRNENSLQNSPRFNTMKKRYAPELNLGGHCPIVDIVESDCSSTMTGQCEEDEEGTGKPKPNPTPPPINNIPMPIFRIEKISRKKKACELNNSNCPVAVSISKLPGNHTPGKAYNVVTREMFEKANRIGKDNSGECISKFVAYSDQFSEIQMTFKCYLGHIFNASVDEAEKSWCPTCFRFKSACIAFADSNKGTFTGIRHTREAGFICEKGHEFTCQSYRTRDLKWCPECTTRLAEEKKLQEKRKLEEEKAQRMKEQERLFAEAKKMMEMEEENSHKKTQLAFQAALKELDQENKDWVASIMSIPASALAQMLAALDKANRDSYFRKMARFVHPDKNKNANAGIAFNKLRQAYVVACK